MTILLDFGVAAPHQNYDVTSRASNDVGFLKNFNTRVFSLKCTILPSYSKIGVGRFFLVHPNQQSVSPAYRIIPDIIFKKCNYLKMTVDV